MPEIIKKIFQKNIEILDLSDKTITYLRLQNFYRALDYSVRTIDAIMTVLDNIIINQTYFNEATIIVDNNSINQMIGGLLEAQVNKDYILLADLLEIQLNPFILNLQEIIINKEELSNDHEKYDKNIRIIMEKDTELGKKLQQLGLPLYLLNREFSVEYTASGLMTLAAYDNNKKYYFHSNGQVLHEAGILAREWISDDKSEYIIYGLGFGYHIKELIELDASIKIRVFESDLNIINLACAFSDMSEILSHDGIELIYDPEFEHLSKSIQTLNQDTSYIIHYPSIRNIKDIRIREQMEDYFVLYSSINNQVHKLNNNFKRNILIKDEYISNIKDKFIGKDLYIVAAGPSLDKNFMELKELGKDSIVISTGTVLKKLLNAGIVPDYAIIIDANDGVYKQIEGIEDVNVPLIYLSTVNYQIPKLYQGKKYVIYQKEYNKAEEYAEKMGYVLFQTGGSVSTTALDIGIQFKCRRIIYVGLDLAYTNNYDHASGTDSINTVSQRDLRQVKDIYGNMVGTSKNLDIYRKWIEKRIKDIKGIEFIDATEGGAKIEGMKVLKLEEIQMQGI